MSSITKSIQNEYVLLMENAFSEKYKYAFRNLELKELRRFILKELISSPELDNQLTNLIVLLNKFWDTHAAALITEVRASKSYRLLLPIQRFGYNISNHLRSLGIYFDSIIMVDPLHFLLLALCIHFCHCHQIIVMSACAGWYYLNMFLIYFAPSRL